MLYFVTGNNKKFDEARKILEIPIKQKKIKYPEIQAKELEKVAIFGIEYVLKKFKNPCFVEDAGLFIQSLKGFPGVYSRYVFDTLGCDGILKLVSEKRDAYFKSVIAFYDGKIKIFEGIVEGRIAREKRGDKGFGFDPIFIPKGLNKTFGEMDVKEKNLYSHRAKALRKLNQYWR